MRKTYPTNKTCDPERKRPEYKSKQKKEEPEELKQPEVLFFMEIPYILIGYPGFETPYAVDEKLRIDFALTGQLRKLMKEFDEFNQMEKPEI